MSHIKHIINKYYDIEVNTIASQKGGWSALAYRIEDCTHTYFLKKYEKSRASTQKYTALIDQYIPITQWLIQYSDLKGKLPVPLLTRDGTYKCEDKNAIYLLYEFIDGETVGEKTLTPKQVEQLGGLVASLHKYGKEIPIHTEDIVESFEVPFIRELNKILLEKAGLLPATVKLLLQPYISSINILIDTLLKLQKNLKNSNIKRVLCHTDLHNWNLMESKGQLILIDWEGLKLAPPEADIMFFTDKTYYSQFMDAYRKTHKDFTLNQEALRFYQIRRNLEDIWEWLEQLLFDRQDEDAKNDSIEGLQMALKDTEFFNSKFVL
ncbi:putative aminoglycoside phosphotransferase [Gottschalkia acidurici 9a]|uniref:Aminoglycoside phosphotransferase n=1 Tax=Gottschalkia acidurici (strain ATCC 7906 / DSM 604 / BCRC 14475 / CIP 104303 / KCTC 5404 / NCIMB 10678 / 9a) TaxID=1128398 RepID=K0B271_GOTA9|nr:phosphotransferase [Gottschalkia acidurici]AFS79020.1 putative aminoglycoside phosphotransferase [Gottschalkia acidurici 9a]